MREINKLAFLWLESEELNDLLSYKKGHYLTNNIF